MTTSALSTPTKLRRGLSVVVPVFNSESSLNLLLERLGDTLPNLGRPFEVILVDDCSTDRSWAVISELKPLFPFVCGARLMRNSGQHNALLCGVRLARFDVIVTLDDDLQNPPEAIPHLLGKLEEGFDVVYGPPQEEQHGILRDLASVITKITLESTMGAKGAREISAFRVFRTRLRAAFESFESPFVSIDVLLTWATTRFSSVRVKHAARVHGKSNYTLKKLVLHALNMFTGFSIVPLRVASFVGFGFTGFGVFVLLYVVVRYFLDGTPVQGFPFLASIVSIFSGAQLFSFGIMGEYVGRIHVRMMNRPPYVIQDLNLPQDVLSDD